MELTPASVQPDPALVEPSLALIESTMACLEPDQDVLESTVQKMIVSPISVLDSSVIALGI